MRRLTIEIPENRQIEINGHVFDILKADVNVLEKASELKSKYAGLAEGNIQDVDLSEVVQAVKDIISYIDEMLGDGATKKIVNGKALGIIPAIKLMTMLCQAVMEEYNQDVSEKYE